MFNTPWDYHEDYLDQNYEQLERLNPFIHGEHIRTMEKEFNSNSISKFKVVKLERGGEEDYLDFKPSANPYGVDRRGIGGGKSDADIAKENEDILRSREEKFLNDDE